MMDSIHLPTQFGSQSDVREACDVIRWQFHLLRQEIGKVIVGNQQVVDLILVALLADGHVLLEGPPGLGKTLLVRTLGDALKLSSSRIQCTADLMPADILGTTVVEEDMMTRSKTFRFRKGPIFHQLLLADEINRATPKCQSAMLEAMQERSVSVDGKTHQLPEPFFVLATQNPIEQEGTYPLPEAQLDRFIFKIMVTHSSRSELSEILNRTTSTEELKASQIISADFLLEAQHIIRHIFIAPHIQDFVSRLILSTHADSDHAPNWVKQNIQIGASPRAAQAIVSSAKVTAVVDGRFAVSKRDIDAVAIAALQHRIIRTFEAQTSNVDPAELIRRLLQEVPFFMEGANNG